MPDPIPWSYVGSLVDAWVGTDDPDELDGDDIATHLELVDGDDETMVHQLIDLEAKLAAYAATVRALRTWTQGQAARLLGEKGAVRVGDTVWRYTARTEERCADPDGFFAWLRSPDGQKVVDRIWNPNTVKKGSLPEAVRDTFFVKERGEAKLQAVPVEKAPKFLRALDDGAVLWGDRGEDGSHSDTTTG